MIENGTGFAERLLRAWERGLSERPVQRAITLLRELGAVESQERLSRMTVAEHDRALFEVRRALFGDEFVAAAACEGCGERLEIAFRGADLAPGTSAAPQRVVRLQNAGDLSIEAGLPTVADLSCAAEAADADGAAIIILQRCIQFARLADREVAFEALPSEALEALQTLLEGADAGANPELQVHCPHCGSVSEAAFDIVGFLWREVEAEALRLLRDVHVLARQYGWREADILAMSPLRRRMYLEMAAA